MRTIQCQRDQGRRSSRPGTDVSTVSWSLSAVGAVRDAVAGMADSYPCAPTS
jgi:hypothetical protein